MKSTRGVHHSEACKQYGDCDKDCRGGAPRKVEVTEADRQAWRQADIERLGFDIAVGVRDEEIAQVIYEEITRGRGYRRFLGKWASNDEN